MATVLLLAIVLLASAGFGLMGARALLALDRGPATLLAGGVAISYGVLLVWQPAPPWISNLGVLLAGSCLGFLLGRVLGSAAAVLTFLTTAAVVDLFSFSDGITNRIIEAYRSGGSAILRFLAVFVEAGGREYAVVGVSDIAILAAAYVGFWKATGVEWESAGWLLIGLLAAFVVGTLTNGAPGIPFLAAAGLVVFLRTRNRVEAHSPSP